MRTRLVFQRVLSNPDMPERRPSVRGCSRDLVLSEVLCRIPAVTCRLFKLRGGGLVDECRVFEGRFAHRGTISPILRVAAATSYSPSRTLDGIIIELIAEQIR